jgi:hypothetical protein
MARMNIDPRLLPPELLDELEGGSERPAARIRTSRTPGDRTDRARRITIRRKRERALKDARTGKT